MGRAGVTSMLASPERQRRQRAAPLALLLLGWGLGLGPLAHAVLAHGEPRVRDSAEQSWLRHALSARPARPTRGDAAPTHRHAPGAPEHLQLAVSATAVCLAVALLLQRVWTLAAPAWRTPLLPRWWRPAVAGAP